MKCDANERIYEVTFFFFFSSFPRLKLPYLLYLTERIYIPVRNFMIYVASRDILYSLQSVTVIT